MIQSLGVPIRVPGARGRYRSVEIPGFMPFRAACLSRKAGHLQLGLDAPNVQSFGATFQPRSTSCPVSVPEKMRP